MELDPRVAQELERMFCEGATPSRLIRHIIECHHGEQELHQLVQMYFFDVFGVPIVRGLVLSEGASNADWHFEFLNTDVLHEMVRNATDRAECSEERVNWLCGLEATDLIELIESARAAGLPELAQRWPELSEKERFVIARTVAGYEQRDEMVRILARLAEVLQQRVLKLENELARLEVQTRAD